MQFADVAAEKYPELFIVQNFEVTLFSNQQVVAKGVKGFDLQSFRVCFAEFGLDALPHFVGGIDGVGDGKNLVGTSISLFDQSSNAAREDGRFAGTGAGDDQHGPKPMLDGVLLVRIRYKCRSPTGDSH